MGRGSIDERCLSAAEFQPNRVSSTLFSFATVAMHDTSVEEKAMQ